MCKICTSLFFLLFSLSQLFAQNIVETTLPDLIPYRKGDMWGYCNQQRQLVIPAIYLWVDPFKKDIAWVHLDSTNEAIIDKSGAIICKVQKDTVLFISDSGRIYKEYNKEIVAVRESDEFWYAPKEYRIKWEVAKDIYLAQNNNNKYGLVDRNENVLMSFKYSHISDMDEFGYFLVEKKSGRKGYINLKSEKLIKFKNKNYGLGSFSEGLAVISKRKGKKELCGFINRKGDVVIPMVYKKAYKFQYGLAEITENMATGFINLKGDTVISFKYGSPIHYPNGFISYDLAFGSLLFDKEGKSKLSVKYDELRYVNDSIIIVGKKGSGQMGSYKYGIIDISGKEI
jgi:WG containing repeat